MNYPTARRPENLRTQREDLEEPKRLPVFRTSRFSASDFFASYATKMSFPRLTRSAARRLRRLQNGSCVRTPAAQSTRDNVHELAALLLDSFGLYPPEPVPRRYLL